MARNRMSQWRSRSVIALAASAVCVYGFPAANLPYVIIDLFHIAVGVFLAVLLLPFLVSVLRTSAPAARIGWSLLAVGTVLGLILIYTGTSLPMKKLLYAHIFVCVLAALFLARLVARRARMARRGSYAASAALRRAGDNCGRDISRRVVVPHLCLEQRFPHHQPADRSRHHERRRRRAHGEILSQLRPNRRQRGHSGEVFHAVEGLRALPR